MMQAETAQFRVMHLFDLFTRLEERCHTTTEMRALLFIAEVTGVQGRPFLPRVTEVSQVLEMSDSATGRMLAKMRDRESGLLESSHFGHTELFCLSPAGRAFLETLFPSEKQLFAYDMSSYAKAAFIERVGRDRLFEREQGVAEKLKVLTEPLTHYSVEKQVRQWVARHKDVSIIEEKTMTEFTFPNRMMAVVFRCLFTG